MKISSRLASASDLAEIVELYAPAEAEQVELREAWGIADGLAEPHLETLQTILAAESQILVVGCIDEVVLAFAWAQVEELLPQADGEQIGVIRIIYVTEPARMVGVGEAMLVEVMEWFRSKGIERFDAIVSPGHRLAKNFFESAGFKARRITMYRREG